MRTLVFLLTWCFFTPSIIAQVRHFTSPDLQGVRKVMLETNSDGERLVSFWKHERSRTNYGGVTVFEISDNQLKKAWEDDNFFMIEDYDAKDLNGDGLLDFAVAGNGFMEGSFYGIALYLSDGKNHYQKHTFARKNSLYNLGLGDVNGNGQTEIIFTEQIRIEADMLQLEIKIGYLQGTALLVRDTGIFMSRDYSAEGGRRYQGFWEAFATGDVDNDGRDEVVIDNWADFAGGRFISVFDLENDEKQPTVNFPRSYDEPYLEDLWVNKHGHIIELQKENPNPRVTSLNGTLYKIAAIELPEVDFTVWKPVQITMPVVLSELRNGDKTARQVTIYGPN